MEDRRPTHLTVIVKHAQGASLHVVVRDEIVLAWSVTIENVDKPVDTLTVSCTSELYVGLLDCMPTSIGCMFF